MKKKTKKQRVKAKRNPSTPTTPSINSASTKLLEAILKMKDSHLPLHQLGDQEDFFAMSSFPKKSAAPLQALALTTRSTVAARTTPPSPTKPDPSGNLLTRSLARLRSWFKRLLGLSK